MSCPLFPLRTHQKNISSLPRPRFVCCTVITPSCTTAHRSLTTLSRQLRARSRHRRDLVPLVHERSPHHLHDGLVDLDARILIDLIESNAPLSCADSATSRTPPGSRISRWWPPTSPRATGEASPPTSSTRSRSPILSMSSAPRTVASTRCADECRTRHSSTEQKRPTRSMGRQARGARQDRGTPTTPGEIASPRESAPLPTRVRGTKWIGLGRAFTSIAQPHFTRGFEPLCPRIERFRPM